MTDASGQAVAGGAFRYDGFGNLLGGDGGLQPSLYNGQQYDAETGLYYLRARYYSPELGRFISADSKHADGNDYAYAGNDPINMVDPSGTESLVGELTAIFIDSFMDTLQIPFIGSGFIGEAFGAAYSGGEAIVQGKSWSDVGKATEAGANAGSLFGMAGSIPMVNLLLGGVGAYTAVQATSDAIDNRQYGLAVYRGLFAVLALHAVAESAGGALSHIAERTIAIDELAYGSTSPVDDGLQEL